MKTVNYIVGALISIMSLGACSKDLLNTTPYDAVSSDQIWKTSNLATLAVNGMYNALLQNSGTAFTNSVDQANFLGLDAHSLSALDPTVSARNNWSSTFGLLNGNATPSDKMYSVAWKQLYEGVNRTNDVIANIDKVEDMSEDLRAQYGAEAKFLRAYFYYRLNCFFRGVPLYLTPTAVNEFTKPRNTETEVWNAIVADLTDCINTKSLPNMYPANDKNYGRATKGAAYALRGKTYLWLKDYKKAAADFEEVTKMGYDLFKGGYDKLFKEANEQCPEMIFSIQCTELNNYGNQMSFKYGSRITRGSCWDDFYGDTDFIDTYETVEGKPFNWNDYLPGYNEMTPEQRSVFFLRDGLDSGEGNFGTAKYQDLKNKMVSYGSDFSKYLDKGNEERLKAAYSDRDPRLQLTYITPYSEYIGSPSGVEIVYTLRWPFIQNDTKDPFDLRSDSATNFHYLVRKFVSVGNELINRQYSPIDVPVIRYADVLLCLAEALNEDNRTDEAVKYVNMVRERAGVALLNSNSFTQVTGKENMRERIRNEKRWELACEGVLYFDELRWGTWYDSKLFEGSGLKQCWGSTVAAWHRNGSHYMKWPIPAAERQMSKLVLDQNDGWID